MRKRVGKQTKRPEPIDWTAATDFRRTVKDRSTSDLERLDAENKRQQGITQQDIADLQARLKNEQTTAKRLNREGVILRLLIEDRSHV